MMTFSFLTALSREKRGTFLALILFPALVALFGPGLAWGETPSTTKGKKVSIADLPLMIDGGAWPTGHVQGSTINLDKGEVYFSFTTLFVKTDLQGKVLGTIEGIQGHLGDLTYNPVDGRVYGSLEYKKANSFYIAIINVDQVNEIGLKASDPNLLQSVYLPEVVADYIADMDGNGVFDGNTAKTLDHRYGCSGIDGVSFGPAIGETEGKRYLTIAYGVYGNVDREDNDHQILIQYETDDWVEKYARLWDAEAPHQSGPEKVLGKYFVFTGNTTWGVQNLAYDESGQRWLLGVYRGRKPNFPNYGLFAVKATAKPVMSDLVGTGERGLLLPLAQEGAFDEATGTWGWIQSANTGLIPLGEEHFYISRSFPKDGKQACELHLHRWDGSAERAFEKVTR